MTERITESDINRLVGKVISNDKKEDRIIRPYNINTISFERWKSKGLRPYTFNRDVKNYGLSEISKPSKDIKHPVYLLTDEEKSKVDKICENIKEIIELKYKSIELLIQQGEAAMIKIIS